MVNKVAEKFNKDTTEAFIKKEKTPDEQLKTTRDNFIKIMGATFKHQSPDNPASPEQIAQTTATMLSTEAAFETNKILHKIRESLSDNKIAKALPFHGKTVQYNTSTKTFDGKNPVEFQYQIKANDQSRPSGAHISTVVTILDEKGLKVFQKNLRGEKGINKFQWEGTDSLGKKVKAGKYNIEIEAAWERLVDGKHEKIPIEAGSFITGKVDSIDLVEGEPKLSIGGSLIDPEDVIKVIIEEQPQVKPKVGDYANYIGQTAEINNDQLTVQFAGSTNINFNCEFDSPGKGSVHLIDEKGVLIGIGIISKLSKGVNEVELNITSAITEKDAEDAIAGTKKFNPVPPGKYKYQLYIQDQLADDPTKYNKISTIKNVTITGLDFTNDPVFEAGNERFPLEAIQKLTKFSSKSSIFQEAINFLGKTAVINQSHLKITPGSPLDQFIRIPSTEKDTYYGDAYMNVYNSQGKKVATLKKPSEHIIARSENHFFTPDNLYNFLTSDSKRWIENESALSSICDTIEEVEAAIPAGPEHNRIFEQFKQDVWNYVFPNPTSIREENVQIDYTAILPNFASLSNAEKEATKIAINANKVVTVFPWDGRGADGTFLPEGEYKYEFLVEKIYSNPASSTNIMEMIKIPDKLAVQIAEYTIDNDVLKLIGYELADNGMPILDAKIEVPMDDILQLIA